METMRQAFGEHKGLWVLMVVFAAAVLGICLWAMCRPGLWLRDTFLYQQKDGSFSGHDSHAAYSMTVTPTGEGAEVRFTLDDETRVYRICADAVGWDVPDVKIYQDGQLVFMGSAQGDPGDALLWGEDDGLADKVNVVVNGEVSRDDLWPSCTWLYNVAIGGRRQTRGTPQVLLLTALFGVLLALDVRFPRLMWNLRHGLEVSGGEPTEWYYMSQKAGRVLFLFAMAASVVWGFFLH